MFGTNDHPDRSVNDALNSLCSALGSWERATGRQSAFILRENNGERPGEQMTAPGYVARAVNGLPLGSGNDDLTDQYILAPMTYEAAK